MEDGGGSPVTGLVGLQDALEAGSVVVASQPQLLVDLTGSQLQFRLVPAERHRLVDATVEGAQVGLLQDVHPP